ncbi:MAG TPA: hypothetical protein PKW86_06755, partial [bacterium]|nr:hypothetical protein [bacterium]
FHIFSCFSTLILPGQQGGVKKAKFTIFSPGYGKIFCNGKNSYCCWDFTDSGRLDDSVKVSFWEITRGYFLPS